MSCRFFMAWTIQDNDAGAAGRVASSRLVQANHPALLNVEIILICHLMHANIAWQQQVVPPREQMHVQGNDSMQLDRRSMECRFLSLTSCLLIPWFASYQVFPLGIDSLRKVNAELLNPAVFFLRAVEGPQAHEGQGQ